MNYSPKLKKAMEQIKTVLKEHDIAGVVVIHTPGFSEYLNHLDTSYSCAHVSPDGGKITVRLKRSEVGQAKAKQLAEDTYNMIVHLSRVTVGNAAVYIDCYELLKDRWGGEEEDGTHTGHTDQNN